MTRETWERTWSSPDGRLVVEREPREPSRHRFRSDAEGDGAVVVARRGNRVLLVVIDRPVVGARLWELPRGQAEREDVGPVSTAARELREETGLVARSGTDVGTLWPDSGLSGDRVHVVVVDDPEPADGPIELPDQHWLTATEIDEAIRDGRIRDGITLGALAIVLTAGESGSRPRRR